MSSLESIGFFDCHMTRNFGNPKIDPENRPSDHFPIHSPISKRSALQMLLNAVINLRYENGGKCVKPC